MLQLGRKRGEAVVIQCPDGTEIRVVVSELVGGRLRLGFEAPLTYKIFREELLTAEIGEKGSVG